VKKSVSILAVLVLNFLFYQEVVGQLRDGSNNTITYEELYDNPYEINKLFVHFQPLYADMFVSNLNIGFGIEANYYWADKFNFNVHARKAYGQRFDVARDLALKNSRVDNRFEVYNYYEFGATYHIVDREEDTESKIILYSTRYKGNAWAAKVPEDAIIPSKIRKVIGARLGGVFFDGTTDLSSAMEKQGVQIVNAEGQALEERFIYGNFQSRGFYLGSSMSWIKNFAIKPDKGYGVLTNDLMFTTFFDIMIAPSVRVSDVVFNNVVYSSDPIKTNWIGMRAGIDGKFNREFGWAYGAEIGYRPSVRGRGFFALVKLSFPVFSTNLDHRKEAFGK
jgi:hypothetical protein